MRQSLSLSETSHGRHAYESVIHAHGIEKRFGRTRALDGLNLDVARGEVHGFLGPNGAGKSTAIRAILGQLRLDGGELTVFGAHPRRDVIAIHSRIAYVPGDTTLWPSLTGGQAIDLLGGLHGRQSKARRDELIERFKLDPSKRARSYSKGNRQKVSLVAALSVEANLLILDEPTSGLDPVMEAVFQSVIREAVEQGTTVLLSSHILDEVEALCDRVTIIRDGRTVSTGTLDDLLTSTVTHISATLPTYLPDAESWAGISDVRWSSDGQNHHFNLTVTPSAVADVVGTIAAAQPSSLVVRPPSLDELFLEHYRGDGS